jgi:hypothetical protein
MEINQLRSDVAPYPIANDKHVLGVSSTDRCRDRASPSTTPSCSSSIPLPRTHVSRTESEKQLAMDVAVAEQRDERMFNRLIHGIRARHYQRVGNSTESEIVSTGPRTPTQSRGRCRSQNGGVDTTHTRGCVGLVSTISKIVDTHNAHMNTSTDRIVNMCQGQYDDSDETQSSSLQNTNRLGNFEVVFHTSESTFSENDWSITGFDCATETHESGQLDSISIHQIDSSTSMPDVGDSEDETIFILDF